jgi:hypothetical protein
VHSAGVVHRDLVGEAPLARGHLLTYNIRRNPVTFSLMRIVILRYVDPIAVTKLILSRTRSVISVSPAFKILK